MCVGLDRCGTASNIYKGIVFDVSGGSEVFGGPFGQAFRVLTGSAFDDWRIFSASKVPISSFFRFTAERGHRRLRVGMQLTSTDLCCVRS